MHPVSAVLAALLTAPSAASTTRVDAAELRLGGERVRVTLSATCPAGATIRVEVTLTAVNGTAIAQGTHRKKADCTGAAQELVLRVDRDSAGALFVRGPATARTVRTVCDAAGCEVIPFDETIRITK
ncbi:hypothetical protein [Paractinoplanes atraurantiacus]|uniref:Neocarzinostatin family protein n=1 Tax=Paractinoplanes atraurantiacus TaxID=1036182 RepID=A0A285JA59_9ACTN|nr:hypothetical protein [Actinoplanes atraurantiacus]SNY56286.1 hypothetical protein SAMN05421748_117118 [Actinoplanes atraurantiacus]